MQAEARGRRLPCPAASVLSGGVCPVRRRPLPAGRAPRPAAGQGGGERREARTIPVVWTRPETAAPVGPCRGCMVPRRPRPCRRCARVARARCRRGHGRAESSRPRPASLRGSWHVRVQEDFRTGPAATGMGGSLNSSPGPTCEPTCV